MEPRRRDPRCCRESIIAMRKPLGQHMTQPYTANRRLPPRVMSALVLAGALLSAPVIFSSAASAQALGYAPAPSENFPQDYVTGAPAPENEASVLPERLRRATVHFDTREAPGTIIIDTGNTVLY